MSEIPKPVEASSPHKSGIRLGPTKKMQNMNSPWRFGSGNPNLGVNHYRFEMVKFTFFKRIIWRVLSERHVYQPCSTNNLGMDERSHDYSKVQGYFRRQHMPNKSARVRWAWRTLNSQNLVNRELVVPESIARIILPPNPRIKERTIIAPSTAESFISLY